MNDPLFDAEDDAATPLTPDERAQLIPTYITTRAQLNEAEQIGIADADRWAFRRKRDVLDEDFLLALHKRMLGGVWQWAGTFRNTERNIGIAAYLIGVELRTLIGDVKYWIEHNTFPIDEIAVRFHHRLVAIHPFPNGNGRHSATRRCPCVGKVCAVPQGRADGRRGYLRAPPCSCRYRPTACPG